MQGMNDVELKRMGANFRSLLNDLKRRPEDAARELDLPLERVQAILGGTEPLAPEIVERATRVWPVGPRDFYLLRDDCPEGVRIMRAQDSRRSARVMERAGKDYYEYRDTAMSSMAPFRPEWIQELCVVEDDDPANPALQWNNGHFMHQFTYFVGPVNFYYRGMNGEKKVAVMETGDSMYISPYVPHTFASRKNPQNQLGHILALTYGNKLVGGAQQELSLLGKGAQQVCLDFSTRARACGSLLRFHRKGLGMDIATLAEFSRLGAQDVEAWEQGEEVPSAQQLSSLARTLNVNARDLMAVDRDEESVLVQKHAEGRSWNSGRAYRLVELTGSSKLPFSKALELSVLEEGTRELDIQVGLHQYVYNLGEPVRLCWESDGRSFSEILGPDDSVYVKPGIPHSFQGPGAKLLVLRIGGRIGGDSLWELSHIGGQHLGRIMGESVQWYDPKGRN